MKFKCWWPYGCKGYWDHGLIMAALDGQLWPTQLEVEHQQAAHPESGGDGGIVIATANVLREPEVARRFMDDVLAIPWALVIHTSDEDNSFRILEELPRSDGRFKLWVQYAGPINHLPADRYHHLGWPPGIREFMRRVPSKPLAERSYRWGFAGQVACPDREIFIEHMGKVNHAELCPTRTFAAGMSQEDYWRFLLDTAIAPCPAGGATPVCFRLYEALEAGCLPVVASRLLRWPEEADQWRWQFKDQPVPFPTVPDWGATALLDEELRDPLLLQSKVNVANAWWQGYKRQLVLDLEEDLNIRRPHPVTILMPTSPVPKHPSTEMIEASIRATRAYPEMRDAEVILMIDGLRKEQEHYRSAYTEYARRLLWLCNFHPDFRGCLPLVFEKHTHQANMTKEALKHVRTRLIFFQEHDTWPIGEIDWNGLLSWFAQDEVNYIRLHIFDRVMEEHVGLYDYTRSTAGSPPIMKTTQWSQRPHLARTGWYRDIIAKYFLPSERTMIEDVVLDRAVRREIDGLYIYAPEGSLLRSATCDGRGSDPKFEMELEPR